MWLLGLLEMLPAFMIGDQRERFRSVFFTPFCSPKLTTASKRYREGLASLTSAILSFRAVNNKRAAFSSGQGLQPSGQSDPTGPSLQQTQHLPFSHTLVCKRGISNSIEGINANVGQTYVH